MNDLLRSLFGFSGNAVGGHSAGSMMLLELEELARALYDNVIKSDFLRLVVDENVLVKLFQETRCKILRHPTELYGLSASTVRSPTQSVLRPEVHTLPKMQGKKAQFMIRRSIPPDEANKP